MRFSWTIFWTIYGAAFGFLLAPAVQGNGADIEGSIRAIVISGSYPIAGALLGFAFGVVAEIKKWR
jgi:hypothetical protein